MSELRIRRERGVAGTIAYHASREYPTGDKVSVTFHGSVYGGPIVMESGGHQVFVTDPTRFGEFGEEWVKRFLNESEPSVQV